MLLDPATSWRDPTAHSATHDVLLQQPIPTWVRQAPGFIARFCEFEDTRQAVLNKIDTLLIKIDPTDKATSGALVLSNSASQPPALLVITPSQRP